MNVLKWFIVHCVLFVVFLPSTVFASWKIDTTPPICNVTFPTANLTRLDSSDLDLLSLKLDSSIPRPIGSPTLPYTTLISNIIDFSWTVSPGIEFTGTTMDKSGNSGRCSSSFGLPWLQVVGDVHSNK